MTDKNSKEQMTVSAIEDSKWQAVDLPLPEDASRELLTAARNAARECANDARRIVFKYAHSEEAEDVGYAAEMQHAEGQALDRIDLIDSRLQGAVQRFPQP